MSFEVFDKKPAVLQSEVVLRRQRAALAGVQKIAVKCFGLEVIRGLLEHTFFLFGKYGFDPLRTEGVPLHAGDDPAELLLIVRIFKKFRKDIVTGAVGGRLAEILRYQIGEASNPVQIKEKEAPFPVLTGKAVVPAAPHAQVVVQPVAVAQQED